MLRNNKLRTQRYNSSFSESLKKRCMDLANVGNVELVMNIC